MEGTRFDMFFNEIFIYLFNLIEILDRIGERCRTEKTDQNLEIFILRTLEYHSERTLNFQNFREGRNSEIQWSTLERRWKCKPWRRSKSEEGGEAQKRCQRLEKGFIIFDFAICKLSLVLVLKLLLFWSTIVYWLQLL